MSCVGAASFRPTLKKNKLTKRDKAHELYPYEENDIVVLGPEIFTDRTGSVINWRGENYIRQTPLTPAQLDPLEIK